MITDLKVKKETLAAEARIIRRQEKRFKKRWGGEHKGFQSMYRHRIDVVRPASRAHCLAYGFLRDREYSVMEVLSYTNPDWVEVEKIAVRFSTADERETKQRFAEWLGHAKAYRATMPTAKVKPVRAEAAE